MRALSPAAAAEVALNSTQPFHLVEMLFSTPLRLSSGPACNWNGYAWTAAGVSVPDILQTDGGGQRAVIRLPNTDGSAGALVMADGITDVACNIWQLHGAGPYAFDDAVPLFAGVLDDADMTDMEVRLMAVSDTLTRERAPRVFFESLCHHIPPAGRVIPWNAEYFKLERRDG